MRNNVAVINPPLTDPTYIDISKTDADSPLIEKVSGSVNAINIAPVSPGIAPTMTPREVPSAISPNADGVARNWIVGVRSGKTYASFYPQVLLGALVATPEQSGVRDLA